MPKTPIRGTTILFLLVLFFLTFPILSFAQSTNTQNGTYTLLAPIGKWITGPFDMKTTGLVDYLQAAFIVGIGIAAALATLMLVICGTRIVATAGSVSAREEAKRCIGNAILGLLLAIGSWVLLNTINPAIVATSVNTPVSDTSLTLPVAPPSSTYSSYEWQPGPTCPSRTGYVVIPQGDAMCAGTKPPGAVCCTYTTLTLRPPPGTPPAPPPLPPAAASPELVIAFADATYTVNESGGSITVSVTRVSGDGSGTITFSTRNGAARVGEDFSAMSGVLSFAPGITSRTVTIPIINDSATEYTEDFSISLSSPTGDIKIGAHSTKQISIIDDDAPPPTVPPPPPDTNAPVLTITEPSTVVFVNSLTPPSATLSFTATDDRGIGSVVVTEFGPLFASQQYTVCTKPDCPTPAITHTMTVSINPSDYGNHSINVRVCDLANNCTQRGANVYVQRPCTSGARLACNKLPSGISEVSPIVCSTSGTNGSGVAVTAHAATGNASGAVHAYEFSISDPATEGGWIHVISGIHSEYPPYFYPYTGPTGIVSTGMTSGQCPAPTVCITDEYGFQVCGPGRTSWCTTSDLESGTSLYCPPIPVNVQVSVSDLPGDMSRGAGIPKIVNGVISGDCGNGTGMPASEVSIRISGATDGPGICRILPNGKYYVNIKTIPEIPPNEPNYTLFWNGLFD